MARRKRKRSKQGLFSKLSNIALTLFAFSRPISVFLNNPSMAAVELIAEEATFGLTKGTFNLQAGFSMYAPVGGAIALGTLKSYISRKFPVR